MDLISDKFYDIGTSDLKELWDDDFGPVIDAFHDDSAMDLNEWVTDGGGGVILHHNSDSYFNPRLHGGNMPSGGSVVLHDRLMTDAVLGNHNNNSSTALSIPIKTEHSYSLQSDDVDSLPDSPCSNVDDEHIDVEDDSNGFDVIKVRDSSPDKCRVKTEPVNLDVNLDDIKDEPLSEPDDSPPPSCPTSPAPKRLKHKNFERYIQIGSVINATAQNVVKLSNNAFLSTNNGKLSVNKSFYNVQQKFIIPKLSVKMEPALNGFTLPPTPPSSNSSSDDSEDNTSGSQPTSPASRGVNVGTIAVTQTQRVVQTNGATTRLLIAPQQTTRQPIHTPLISSQPKGSTGQLVLTEEEKRTLLAEGYPVPTRLPLTKAEEKSLKKIRRKIKNKISAQESRRKKKEYMDQLERRVEVLVGENCDYRKKIETLEDSNKNLVLQLARLQTIIARSQPLLKITNKTN